MALVASVRAARVCVVLTAIIVVVVVAAVDIVVVDVDVVIVVGWLLQSEYLNTRAFAL